MDGIVAKDPRVLAILTNPDDYFEHAWRRARRQARLEVAVDLGRRARRRRYGAHLSGVVLRGRR